MVEAIVAVEDRRFYSHHGLDPIRIVGAAMRNVRAGGIREGGSTITQQLARAAQLSPARTFERKMREAMIALRLGGALLRRQRSFRSISTPSISAKATTASKRRRAATSAKPAAELDAAGGRAAGRARPMRRRRDAPSVSPERARRRRNLVLRLMRQQGRITEADSPPGSPSRLAEPRTTEGGGVARLGGRPAATSRKRVRRQLVAMFGPGARAARRPARHSTYDPALQRAAEQAIATRVAEIAKTPHAGRRTCRAAWSRSIRQAGDVLALVGGTQLRREPVQPRDAGTAPGRVGVQADHLRRGARARLRAGLDAARSRHADRRLRRGMAAGRRARRQRVHAAQGAEGVEQSRRGAAAAARRRRHRRLLCASARHRLAICRWCRRSRSAPAK